MWRTPVFSTHRRLDIEGLGWAYYGAMGASKDNSGGRSRRQLLTGLAASGAGTVLSNIRLDAQAPGGATRRLDLHHHFANPALIKLMAEKKMSGWQTWTPYSPAKAIEDMEKGGVQASMISITTPGIWFGSAEETRRLARELNEYGARMVSDYPGRFGLFAVLPFPNANDCLKEIEYAFDTLKADGVGLLSSYSNKWHGDVAFADVFRELNRRKAIIYTQRPGRGLLPEPGGRG